MGKVGHVQDAVHRHVQQKRGDARRGRGAGVSKDLSKSSKSLTRIKADKSYDNSGLFFNDLRKFGWIKVADKPEQPKGNDVLSKNFNLQFVNSFIHKTNKPIKLLLIDQDKIAGVGNIYANDALFLAKINPLRRSNTLTAPEINNLYKAIKKVIEQGLKHGGSSGADEAYIRPDAKKGEHQKYFMVYQREGEPCSHCKTPIKRIKQGGRSSFFCPVCQK